LATDLRSEPANVMSGMVPAQLLAWTEMLDPFSKRQQSWLAKTWQAQSHLHDTVQAASKQCRNWHGLCQSTAQIQSLTNDVGAGTRSNCSTAHRNCD
jgi:hypothetical protein